MKSVLPISILIAIVVISVYARLTLYHECRAHGFSEFYCFTQR